MTLGQVRRILQEAKEVGTVTSIYFEGGEPFLYYPVLLRGIIEARDGLFNGDRLECLLGGGRGKRVGVAAPVCWIIG